MVWLRDDDFSDQRSCGEKPLDGLADNALMMPAKHHDK